MTGWRKVSANQGAAGGDRVSVEAFAANLDHRLAKLSADLREGKYRPGPLRRVEIPKSSGGLRRLSIPCVVDRVAQSAVAQRLSAVLETEFEEASFGYRPGRGVADALRLVEELRRDGFVWTLDADIDDYFDSVPIDRAMDRLHRSISESPLTELIGLWLEHGATLGRGLPQGSPLSPLLANLYLDDLDEAFDRRGLRIVRYADDFLVFAKDRAGIEQARGEVAKLLAQIGLTLDPKKTAIRSYDDSLKFLGRVFVRAWVLQSDDAEDPLAEALSAVARSDREEQKAADALRMEEEGMADAGYDRGLRLLHVRGRGRRLGLRNLSFSVRAAADEAITGEGEEIAAIHASRIDRIELGPEVEADLSVLKHALHESIPVAFVDWRGETLGQLTSSLTQRAGRHLAQARISLDEAKALVLARLIVEGRIANQRSLLRRLNHRRGLEPVQRTCITLNGLERRARHAASLDLLRGFEGAATKVYWRAWAALLLHGFHLPQRLRRASADPVNIALDTAAGLLLRDMGAIVLSAGLHPGFGVLHATADYRDACVYDLVEEFRAGMVESVVLTALNGRRISQQDFTPADGGWRMNREAGDALIRAYEERAQRPILVPRLGRRMTWRRAMREQADLYAAHCEGRATYQPYVLDN
jgi:CRISPR-associated protein Cas1